jgi:hypothetical protein
MLGNILYCAAKAGARGKGDGHQAAPLQPVGQGTAPFINVQRLLTVVLDCESCQPFKALLSCGPLVWIIHAKPRHVGSFTKTKG